MLINISLNFNLILIYILIFTIILLTLYTLFDVNYYLTVIFVFLWCHFRKNKQPVSVEKGTEYYGVCLTTDLDIYFHHMNNARYLRELDFARLHFYKRTNLYEILRENNAPVLLSASHIRYRRSIPLFAIYKITTKMIFWDEKNFYFEHQFITCKDGFVATVVVTKQTVVKGINVMFTVNKLLGKEETYKPADPVPELEDFISFNHKSSSRLKKSS